MSVLERSELEASPLADLHEIASEAESTVSAACARPTSIDAILGEQRRRARGEGAASRGAARTGAARKEGEPRRAEEAEEGDEKPRPRGRSRRTRARGGAPHAHGGATAPEGSADAEERVEGVVEVLGNGSAFLRVDGPEPSDADVYISAAQVRRCELVSGDKVSGPVRKPRRSERYPSLVRVDTINGTPADEVSDGARYDELPVAWPKERIEIGAKGDSTLEAIELLTPLGRGSRALVVGPRQSGKSETLRRLASTVARGSRRLEVSAGAHRCPARGDRRLRRGRGRAAVGARASPSSSDAQSAGARKDARRGHAEAPHAAPTSLS